MKINMKIGTMSQEPVFTRIRKPPVCGRVFWVRRDSGEWLKVTITEIKKDTAVGVLYFASL